MPLQGFVDKNLPAISAAWANAVDVLKFTIFADATTKAAARTALTSDAPLEIANGGTGSRGSGATWLTFLASFFPQLYQYINPQTPAETLAGVTPVNYAIPSHEAVGYIDVHRYGALGNNSTDDLAALNNAALVAIQLGTGAEFMLHDARSYRLSAVWKWSTTAFRWKLSGRNSVLRADHNGSCLDITVINQNYGNHTLEDVLLRGPNVDYPFSALEAAGTSTGAGLLLGDASDTSNAAVGYLLVMRNVKIRGFLYGRYWRAVLLCNTYGGEIRFNKYGDYYAGGQCNANHCWGTVIRENRIAGIWSNGDTGGSLTNATANGYHGCEIESNIPFRGDDPPGYSGGYPSTMDTSGTVGIGIYLSNSYDFVFDDMTYCENQNYSLVIAGSSDSNMFDGGRFDGGGGGRIGGVKFMGAGVINNKLSKVVMIGGGSTTANVETDHANHAQNQFLDCQGFNFIDANLVGVPFVHNNIKNQSGGGMVIANLDIPTEAIVLDVAGGTTPGTINGIGTATATLYAQGYGEIGFGTGGIGASGSNTTISTIDMGIQTGCFLLIRNYQTVRTVTIKNNSTIFLKNGLDRTFNALNDFILFWVSPLGHLIEIESGRKAGYTSAMTAGSVTVAHTGVNGQSAITATRQPGGTNPGAWYCTAITPGTSFVLTSTNASDTGIGYYEIK